jgi:UDP-GlcNAc:undecaprenyl-phosphate GlcNAc-1-phosphate transferase
VLRAIEILVPFAIALVAAAILTPLVRSFAAHRRILSYPQQDRWHRQPVALLGGVAMAGASVLGIAATAELRPLVPLLVCSGLMFALGVVDDLQRLKPVTKLVGQMVVAAVTIYLALPIHITGVPVLDLVLAFAWIVGITNAFNLLDNIDGLAAGVAAIGGTFYLMALFPAESTAMVPALAAFVGAMIGFLIFNVRPASIFMGDSGSHFIGSFLAGVSLLAMPGLETQLASILLVPLLILLVPIFDTFLVMLTRRLAGRSAILGGRDHSSHRLVRLGASERDAVFLLYSLAALGGAVALSYQHLSVRHVATLTGFYVLLLMGLGVVLGHVKTSDAGAAEDEMRTAGPLVSELTYRYRVYEVLLDMALIVLAYYAAFSIRFAEPQFSQFLPYFVTSFPLVVALQLASLWWVGKYRQVGLTFGSSDLITILKGLVIGVSASVLLLVYLYRFIGFSRSVFVTDGVILAFLLVGSRVLITKTDEYLRKRRTRGGKALIYGAGKGGHLLVRELLQNPDIGLTPAGIIDDDPAKRRWNVEGIRVVGSIVDLPAILERDDISAFLIAIRDLPTDQTAVISGICREHGVILRRMRFALDVVEPAGPSDRISAASWDH